MAILKITIKQGPAQRAELNDAVVVGRSPDCQVHLRVDDISRQHCRFEPSEEGWTVIDLGSKNGTFVKSERIERHLLKDGDEVCIGTVKLKFIADALAENAHSLEAESHHLLGDTAPGDAELSDGTRVGQSLAGTDHVAGQNEKASPAALTTETRHDPISAAAAPLTDTPVAAARVETTPPTDPSPASAAPVEKGPAAARRGKRSLWDLANTPTPPARAESDKPRESSKHRGVKLKGESDREPDPESTSGSWRKRRIPVPVFIAIAGAIIAVVAWELYNFLTT